MDELKDRRFPLDNGMNKKTAINEWPSVAPDGYGEIQVQTPEPGADEWIPEQTFRQKIARLINSVSRENASNTPDFILADFIEKCLLAFENANNSRERWYGKYLNINEKTPIRPIPDQQHVDTRSPEGYLFNAAMAILTTEFMPHETFGGVFTMVRDLALQIQQGDSGAADYISAEDFDNMREGDAQPTARSVPESEDPGSILEQRPPVFHNAGNRNEKQP